MGMEKLKLSLMRIIYIAVRLLRFAEFKNWVFTEEKKREKKSKLITRKM